MNVNADTPRGTPVIELETEHRCGMCRLVRVERDGQVCRTCQADFNEMMRLGRRDGY